MLKPCARRLDRRRQTGDTFWLPHNELQICCRLLLTVLRAAVAMRVGRRGNTTRAVKR